jgi:hypothetical protein
MVNSYSSQFYNKNVKQKLDYLITLDEVKRHLNIDELDTSNDEYLSDLIQVGVQFCENYINSDIALTKNTLSVYDFRGDRLKVDEGNLITVSGLTGTTVTYGLFDNIIDFNLYFDSFISSDTDLILEYYSGFSKSSLPRPIQQSILIKIADLFDVERNNYTTPSYKANNVIDILLGYYKKY